MTIQSIFYRMSRTFALCVFGIVGATTAISSHAEPYLVHKDGAMVLDKATGLVWMRCSLGQTWDGTTCAGKIKTYTFDQALQAAKDFTAQSGVTGGDWLVPTIRQLHCLLYCSSGYFNTVDLPDGLGSIKHGCAGPYSESRVNLSSFPDTSDTYWSSSRTDVDLKKGRPRKNAVLTVDFKNAGTVGIDNDSRNQPVRLVRSSKFRVDETELDYVDLYTAVAQEKRLAAERSVDAERVAATKRAEQEAIDRPMREAREARASQERQMRAEQEARAAKVRETRGCKDFYPGRVGNIKGDSLFATSDQYIIRYVNSERRRVTIEGTSGGNTMNRGEIREMSCADLLRYE